MATVKVKDKEFKLYISAKTIHEAISKMADKMNHDLKGKNPLFLSVLNGSFLFTADLLRMIKTDCEVSFIKLSSYSGTSTTGKVKELIGLTQSLKGRTVVVLEDIVDTGITMEHIKEEVDKLDAAEVLLATLLFKPDSYNGDLKMDYIGIEIPNDFVVGYGLDYDGAGRNLADIYKIVEDKKTII